VFAIVVGVVVALFLGFRFFREPENRGKVVAEMEKRPYLRPIVQLGRRLRPQFEFLGRRLTPGGLGLELTTLLAVLSVGLFVLIAYGAVISGEPGPTPGDVTAVNVANDIRTAWLDDVAKAITNLGSGWVVFPLAVLAAIWLGMNRRWIELGVLASGIVLIVLLVHGIKDWTDRPRPSDPLIHAGGSSFPSAHAAYATFYTWIAVTVAFRVDPGITRRSLLIGAGIVLTALIGLTRVYLRVH